MKEAYVSFEAAKRLKKKGFNWPCTCYYDDDGIMHEALDYVRQNDGEDDDNEECLCPTQQMAMRWLREEKDIDIIPFHEKLPNDCYWCRIERNLFTAHEQEPIYSTYEDAVEAALQYCLTNLI